MTVPFWCLLVAVVLPYVWAGVGGRFKAKQFGTVDANEPRVQAALLEGAGRRAVAAQDNAWEALPVFGAAVTVAHLAGADASLSAVASVIWVVARVTHGVAYVRGIASLRVAGFFVGLMTCLWLFGLAARA